MLMKMHGTAATVVLLRDSPDGLQVLLLERPRHRGSFAGAWVFPGGLVDPEDYQDDDGAGHAGAESSGGSGSGAPDGDAELAAVRRAGVRETEEETGLQIAAPDLVLLSCWVPPPEAPRRYRTWFFLAEAPEGDLVLSPDEHVDAAWLTPEEAFRRQREGRMELVPPTWVTLHGLLGRETVAEALAEAAAAVPETFATRQLSGDGPAVMVWAGDSQYPGTADVLAEAEAEAEADAEAGQEPGQEPEHERKQEQEPVPARLHRLVRDGSGWSYQRSR